MLLIPIASLAGMTLPESERGGQAMSDDALEGLMQDAEQVLPVCVLGLRRFWQDRAAGSRDGPALALIGTSPAGEHAIKHRWRTFRRVGYQLKLIMFRKPSERAIL